VRLQQFVESADERTLSLVVVNRESPTPIQTMLEGLFEGQPVEVDERHLPGEDDDVVLLVDDGDVAASSSLVALQESILLVNSDLYITGTRAAADVEIPDVVAAMEDVRFTLRGYPESNKEKLLLITISRHIERMALENDGGTHRASFQRLSRIDDELGTRRVYERLAASGVDTHVYGVPDWTPPPDFEVTMHGGWTPEFRDSWFVTFVSEFADGPHAALVALETAPRVWDGFWTFDPGDARRISRYVERRL
jgi:hypothetical protein